MIRVDNESSINRVILLGFKNESKYLFKDNIKIVKQCDKVCGGNYYEFFRYKSSLINLINYGVHFSDIFDSLYLVENPNTEYVKMFLDCRNKLIYRLNHYLLNSGNNIVCVNKMNLPFIEKYIGYIEKLTCRVVYCDEIELSHFLNNIDNRYIKI